MKRLLSGFMLVITLASHAVDQESIPLSLSETLQWDRLIEIDAMSHASFCRIALQVNNSADAQSRQIVATLNSQKFCTTGDFDGDGESDLGLVYENDYKEYPPCRSLLVLGYRTQTPEIYRFVIDRAQSCNLQTFDPKRFSGLYGTDSPCARRRADADTLVIYGEGDVTTLFTLDQDKTRLHIQHCYGGAD